MRALLFLLIPILAACTLPDWAQESAQSLADLCLYEQWGIGSPVPLYTDPRLGEPEFVAELELHPYVVVGRTELWYTLKLEDGTTGWVRWGGGQIAGDCADVPLYRMRPIPPQGSCTLYLDPDDRRDYVLYSLPIDISEIVAVMPEGEYVLVEARTDYDHYRLRLSDGTTGWLLEPSQVLYYQRALNGTCADIPYEQVDTGPGG